MTIPDLLELPQVIPYIHKRTGVWVSRCRVGRWINRGDLVVMRLPGRPKRRVTRKTYVEELIRRYSQDNGGRSP